VSVPEVAEGSAEADALRAKMVDWLLGWGGLRSAAVEAAMRAVPRHLFVPEASLKEAYGPESVVTHWDEAGAATSSATGPAVVASMLEQLDVRPGHRVLEVGAGTGYNAACLAELAGPSGSVTTIDIGAEMAADARRGLAAAGFERVHVVHGDGADGYGPGAPYDRIIVTAGAWEVMPAWREQLAEGGRLVLPLRVRGITRTVALESDGGIWRSTSLNECGFMPMRGPHAVEERNVELPPATGVRIRVDDGQPADLEALGAALGTPPAIEWPGVVVPRKPLDHLDFWLAGASARVCRVIPLSQALEAGLVPPLYAWGSMGCYSSGTLGYMIRRPAGDCEGQMMMELGACAYGPDAQWLAGEIAGRILAWSQARPGLSGLRIEVHPAGKPVTTPAMITAEKRHGTVLVIQVPA
jgi:protein-L-isoaspartate(D-aspartate) O-methyltransferase